MAIDIANGWLRHDGASASNQYWGYNFNQNASDTDSTWSIRQVTSSGNIETVKWTNGSMTSMISSWANRTQSFQEPSGSLGLTYSKSGGNGLYSVTLKWNKINGLDKYIISTLDSSGCPIDPTGNKIIGQYVTSTYSYVGLNTTQYTQRILDTNATYSFTLIGQNVAGITSSSVNIYFP